MAELRIKSKEELYRLLTGFGANKFNEYHSSFRKAYPNTRLDLRGLYLAPYRLAFLDLQGADLREADFTGITVDNVNLKEADLRKAKLLHLDIRGMDVTDTTLPNQTVYEWSTNKFLSNVQGLPFEIYIAASNLRIEKMLSKLTGQHDT